MSARWRKVVDGQADLIIEITEVEPGLVHITTDALVQLLQVGGFINTPTPEKETTT